MLGADYRPTDNWPVPYRCISVIIIIIIIIIIPPSLISCCLSTNHHWLPHYNLHYIMQCASVYTNLRWHGLRAWSAVARTQESLGYWGCHAAGRAFLSPGSASIDIVLDVSVVYLPVTQWRLHLRTTSSSGNSQTEISSRTCPDTLRSSTRCPSIKTMSSFLAVNSLCYGHTALSPVCLSVVYMGLSLLMLRLRNFCFQLVLQNSQKLSCLSEKNAKRPWVTKAGTLVYGTA